MFTDDKVSQLGAHLSVSPSLQTEPYARWVTAVMDPESFSPVSVLLAMTMCRLLRRQGIFIRIKYVPTNIIQTLQ